MGPEWFKSRPSLTKNQSRCNRSRVSPNTIEEVLGRAKQVIQKYRCSIISLELIKPRAFDNKHTRLLGYGNAFRPALLVRSCEQWPFFSHATLSPFDESQYDRPLLTTAQHRCLACQNKCYPSCQEAHELLLYHREQQYLRARISRRKQSRTLLPILGIWIF